MNVGGSSAPLFKIRAFLDNLTVIKHLQLVLTVALPGLYSVSRDTFLNRLIYSKLQAKIKCDTRNNSWHCKFQTFAVV
jgi:hypothetical protein